MKLTLLVLDGPLKGKYLRFRENLVLGSKRFSDPDMLENHAIISLDQNFLWKIEALHGGAIRAGSSEAPSLSLVLGLIFHLGQTGFKVVERPKLWFSTWESGLIDYLSANDWEAQTTDFFFFLYPVRLTFLQGPQTDEFYTLSYGPRELGFNNMDLTLKDPSQPRQIAKFFQIGETAYIQSLCGDKMTINDQPIDQHPIQEGDRLAVGSNLIELTILK